MRDFENFEGKVENLVTSILSYSYNIFFSMQENCYHIRLILLAHTDAHKI